MAERTASRALRLGVIAVSLAALTRPALAQEDEPASPAPFPYAGQSRFVTVPARALASPAQQAGFMAGALLCLPGSLYQEAHRQGEVPKERQPSIVCGRALGSALGWPIYAAAGLPFLLLEAIFWDAPRAVARRLRREGGAHG